MDILCCTAPIFREPGWEAAGWGEDHTKCVPSPREAGKKAEGADMVRSMRRARAKLRRLALANGFEYFVTLTLDPAKIDRYDGAAVTKALGTGFTGFGFADIEILPDEKGWRVKVGG